MIADDFPTDPDDPRLQGWYHSIDLGNGLVPRAVYDLRGVVDQYGIPDNLEGMEVLDVGTGDGFFAFEMERRGAARVVAVDLARLGDCDWLPQRRAELGAAADNQSWPSHFRLAKAMRRSSVEYRHGNVYDLSPYDVGTFDLVFCGSLLLHLQNPLKALHAIRSVTRTMAVVETSLDAKLEARPDLVDRAVLGFGPPDREPRHGENNVFWQFTSGALQKMLEFAGFERVKIAGVFKLPPTEALAASAVAYT